MRRAYVALAAAVMVACAVMEPPSGGPEDKVPPEIVEVVPRPDSAGVSRDCRILITFSEKVNGDSFKNRFRIYPPEAFDKVAVKGDRLEVTFRELLPETTFCVLLKAGYKDNHNVESTDNYVFNFSTADRVDRGSISGFVHFKGKPDSTGVVKLFEIRADSVINVHQQPESRMAFASRSGIFSFGGLPSDSTMFLLWAFTDRNGDAQYAAEKEFSAFFPDTVVLGTMRWEVEDIVINIIDPNEPGTLSGRLVNETGLAAPLTVRLSPILPGERAIVAVADTLGLFSLKVPPGRYIFQTFVDMAADSICGQYRQPEDSTVAVREPCIEMPDTLIVKPGEAVQLEPITLGEGGSGEHGD